MINPNIVIICAAFILVALSLRALDIWDARRRRQEKNDSANEIMARAEELLPTVMGIVNEAFASRGSESRSVSTNLILSHLDDLSSRILTAAELGHDDDVHLYCSIYYGALTNAYLATGSRFRPGPATFKAVKDFADLHGLPISMLDEPGADFDGPRIVN